MPETTAKRAPSSSAGSKPSSAVKAESRRSYQTVVGRGGTPSSAKNRPSRPSGAQATPLRSTPAAASLRRHARTQRVVGQRADPARRDAEPSKPRGDVRLGARDVQLERGGLLEASGASRP